MTDTPAPAEALSILEQATRLMNRELRGKLYQHKNGGVYLEYSRRPGFGQEAGELVFSGIMGAPLIQVTDDVIEDEEIVCYRDVLTGDGYARPARLFDDGRFVPLGLAPTTLSLLTRAERAEAELRLANARLRRIEEIAGYCEQHKRDYTADWNHHIKRGTTGDGLGQYARAGMEVSDYAATMLREALALTPQSLKWHEARWRAEDERAALGSPS